MTCRPDSTIELRGIDKPLASLLCFKNACRFLITFLENQQLPLSTFFDNENLVTFLLYQLLFDIPSIDRSMNPITRLPFSDLSNRQRFSFTPVPSNPTVVDPGTRKPFKASIQAKPPKLTNREFVVVGSWTRMEHLAFLHGLRLYGPGKWKKLCDLIPTRYVALLDEPASLK